MTDITIHARGPRGCGKTAAINALISAARQIGLFNGEDLKSGRISQDMSGEHVEVASFTAHSLYEDQE